MLDRCEAVITRLEDLTEQLRALVVADVLLQHLEGAQRLSLTEEQLLHVRRDAGLSTYARPTVGGLLREVGPATFAEPA
jgi:hypothetical protein